MILKNIYVISKLEHGFHYQEITWLFIHLSNKIVYGVKTRLLHVDRVFHKTQASDINMEMLYPNLEMKQVDKNNFAFRLRNTVLCTKGLLFLRYVHRDCF